MSLEAAGRRRVQVDFRAAFGKVTQQTGESRFRHRARPGQPEHGVRNLQTGPPCMSAEQRRPWRGQIGWAWSHRWLYFGQDPRRLDRHPQSAQAVTPADRDDLAGDRRVKVKMLVGIDVIEREPGRPICFELRLDFRRDLSADRRAREYIEPETDHVAAEPPRLVDEIRQTLRRQDRSALHQHQMQPDAQLRKPTRPRDRVLRRGAADHEAGSRQDAALMRSFDRFVDFACKPKIVGGDDDLLQSAGSRRSRRKRKNSIPSRSRRFNMSGLLTISPAMAAIFGARK